MGALPLTLAMPTCTTANARPTAAILPSVATRPGTTSTATRMRAARATLPQAQLLYPLAAAPTSHLRSPPATASL
eukprot:scaffold61117_cov25-Tisochrysis_lutea.AAC.2